MRLPSSTPAATIAGSRIPNSKTLKVQLWDTVRRLYLLGNDEAELTVTLRRLVKSGSAPLPATTTVEHAALSSSTILLGDFLIGSSQIAAQGD
jgi:hypothetical protein